MRPVLVGLIGLVGLLGPLLVAGPSQADEVPVFEDYLLHCSACHGADGSGKPGVTPSLAAVGDLFKLEGGRAYLIQVPGVAQAPLSDARLARLLNWTVKRHGCEAVPPFAAEEVGRLRRTPLRDPAAARPQAAR